MPTPRRAAFIITNIAGEALVRLADQRADRAVEHDLRGRVAVDAHLVLEPAAVDAVALAEAAVGVRQELRHDEQRDALRAGRRVRQARQHEVDDVRRQVVLAGRDEDLVAGELVGAVGSAARPWCAAGRGRCRTAARSGTWCRSIRRSSASAGRSSSARRCRARAAPRRRRARGPGTSSRPGSPSSASRRSTGSRCAAGPGRRTPDRC